MIDFIEKIKAIREDAKLNFVPIVRDRTIMTASKIVKNEKYKNILEIGTATGYSGIILLASSGDGTLTSIEKNEDRQKSAVANFKEIGLEKRATLLLGDALIKLGELAATDKKFDFIFLDGPKGQYITYLPILKSLLQENGTLFADNVLLGGLIKDSSKVTHKNRTMTTKMQKFIDAIMTDKDFEAQMFELEDGFIVAKLKNSTEI